MLLVYYGNAEVRELYGIFDKRMGSDEDIDLAKTKVFENLFAFLALYYAGEEFNPNGHIAQKLAYCFEMLLGKNLGRRHYARLKAVVYCQKHAHQGNERLSAAHITLNKAVHLLARLHIGMNLLDYAFLRSGEFEGQFFGIERIENLPYPIKDEALIFLLAVFHQAENVELYVEEFFELES